MLKTNKQLILIILILKINLYSYDNSNGGRIYIEGINNKQRIYPSGFFKNEQIENNKETSSLKYKPKINIEIGMAFVNEAYLEINPQIEFPTINRTMEFYSKQMLAPVFKINFRDLSISKKTNLLFRNNLQLSYLKYSSQTPFLPNGFFPYGKSLPIGSEINALSFSWIGSVLYRAGMFYVGPYFGAGVNILNGKAMYVTYAGDLNNSMVENIGVFKNSIIEKGDTIILSDTFSMSGKYGAVIHIDLLPFRFSFGINYSITNESNLYWIERSYFLEAKYVFYF